MNPNSGAGLGTGVAPGSPRVIAPRAGVGLSAAIDPLPPVAYNPPSGVSVTPATLASQISSQPAGTIFNLQDGAYSNTDIIPKANMQFWAVNKGGAVFTGPGAEPADPTAYFMYDNFDTSLDGVVLGGLIVQEYKDPGAGSHGTVYATRAEDWEIHHCEFRENRYAGAYIGAGAIVKDSHFHHNRRTGLKIGGGGGYLVENNECNHNNYLEEEDPLWDAGGIKNVFGDSGGGTIRNNHCHDNHGSGIWLDIDQDNVTIEYNITDDNYTNGIVTEISQGTIIRYNTVRRNGLVFGPSIGFTQGPGIQVQNANDVDIHDNTVEGNYNGIMLVSTDSRPHLVRNVDVNDNAINDCVNWANGASEFGSGDAGLFSGSNLDFQGNTYSGNPTNAWRWDGTLNFAGWQAEGFDA